MLPVSNEKVSQSSSVAPHSVDWKASAQKREEVDDIMASSDGFRSVKVSIQKLMRKLMISAESRW
jgi:hypothetical protein